MGKVSVKLTVFFEDSFWIGVIERISEARKQRQFELKQQKRKAQGQIKGLCTAREFCLQNSFFRNKLDCKPGLHLIF